MARKSEIEWDFGNGANWLFPEEWDQFVSHIPDAEQGDLIEAYFRRLSSEDEAVRLAAGSAWGAWEPCRFSMLPTMGAMA